MDSYHPLLIIIFPGYQRYFYCLQRIDSVLAIGGQVFSRSPKPLAARSQEKTSGTEGYHLPSPLNFDLSYCITFILNQSDRTSPTVTIWTVTLLVVFLPFLPCFQLLFHLVPAVVLTLETSEMSAIFFFFTSKTTQPCPQVFLVTVH